MKWILRLLGVILALVIFLIGAVFFLPAERLARIVTDQLSTATGRDVSVNGDVALTFWPVLGVSADDLVVSNADWAEQGPMFEAANAAIGVDALSLFRGDIRITKIEAHSPTIRLEQKQDGRASWQFADASDSKETKQENTPKPKKTKNQSDAQGYGFSIERLEVTNAILIYDAAGSDLVSLDGVDLTLDWPDPEGPAQINAIVRPGGKDVFVDLAVEAFSALVEGKVSPLRAVVKNDAGQITFDGRASIDGAVAGAFGIVTDTTDGFLRALGLPAAGLPPKLGHRVSASTELTLTPDRQLSLRDLKVDLGGNAVSGAADISLNGTPQINARLDAGDLDLGSPPQDTPRSSGGGKSGSGKSGGKPAKPSTTGWPKTPIDASALAAFHGDIALSANSIDLGDFQLGRTRAVLRNQNSRMVFELREVAAYGGEVTGEFVINNRGGLSVGGKMDVTGIQMQPLLKDAIDLDRLTGKGDIKLSFLGAGESVDAIMRSLSGNGALQIGQGTLIGINLDQLLSGGSHSGTTIFNDLSATWTTNSGVLSNKDLVLSLKNYRATGEGNVDLGKQRINYRITPVALRANSGKGLAVPVILKGPWSDISIKPDVEAVLDAELDKERRRLERKAKKKALKKLDVEAPDSKSLEDELKDKLLKKLFD